jgi:hypothetical protein
VGSLEGTRSRRDCSWSLILIKGKGEGLQIGPRGKRAFVVARGKGLLSNCQLTWPAGTRIGSNARFNAEELSVNLLGPGWPNGGDCSSASRTSGRLGCLGAARGAFMDLLGWGQ